MTKGKWNAIQYVVNGLDELGLWTNCLNEAIVNQTVFYRMMVARQGMERSRLPSWSRRADMIPVPRAGYLLLFAEDDSHTSAKGSTHG